MSSPSSSSRSSPSSSSRSASSSEDAGTSTNSSSTNSTSATSSADDKDVDILGDDDYAAGPFSSDYAAGPSSMAGADDKDVDILGDDDSAAGAPSSMAGADDGDDKQLRLDICGSDEGDYAAAESFFGNACLDLFLLDAEAPPQRLRDLLAAAWDQDALTALKLVCHRHDVKRNSEGFFTAITWMLRAHPRVFVDNLPVFADLGYVQDLVDILDHLLVAEDDRRREADSHVNLQPAPAAAGLDRAHDDDPAHHAPTGLKRARDGAGGDPAPTSSPGSSVPTAERKCTPKRARQQDPGAGVGADANAPPSATAVADRAPSPSAGAAMPAALLDVADSTSIDLEAVATFDPLYNTLYRAMSNYFVDRLRTDLGHLNNGDTSKITRAANRCSAMTSPYEQTTFLRMDIARGLLPNPNQEPRQLVLDLHRSVLSPLTLAAKLEAPEERKVPQITLPHLIASGFGKEGWDKKTLKKRGEITSKWRNMVDDLRGRGSLSNCLAVCDVSLDSLGSMKMVKVCVALGLLITELGEAPWKNWMHAFSEGVRVHSLEEEASYPEKVEAIRKLKCDGRFNLRKLFEWVLHQATSNNVEPKDMVKTIFVITGKEFDHAIVPPAYVFRPEDLPPKEFDAKHVRQWNDDYRIVCDKFKEQGYGDRVPGVVFWNLRGNRSAALTASTDVHDGILSLSGYSDDLLRLVLKNGGVVHPEDEMSDAITGEKYGRLEV